MNNTSKTLLITGASSYVGARVYFDLKSKYPTIGTYFMNQLSESFFQLDASDKNAVMQFVTRKKPNVVIHVANYSSPKYALNNEESFFKLNKTATQNIVEAANAVGAKVIFISSQAANNPDNVYGELKVASEQLVKKVEAGYLILRPSLIVGFSPNTTNPRPFNRILSCLDNPSSLAEFDTSWQLYPTYLGHLSQAIDSAIRSNLWNTIIPIFINEVVTQYQIAQDILKPFGVSVQPIDQKLHIPLSQEDLTQMNSLQLTPNTYPEMVAKIVEEINQRKIFSSI